MWSDIDGLYAGDVVTPSFVEKLLSEKRDQGDRELRVIVGGLAFVASQGVPGRNLVAEKRYS